MKEEVTEEQSVDLRPTDLTALVTYTHNDKIPEAVRKAIEQAMELRRGATDIQRRIQLKELELSHIPADQTRIRENMKVVDKSSDYYNDLLKKLRAQETQLETVNKELAQLRADLETQQKKLDDYLKDLMI